MLNTRAKFFIYLLLLAFLPYALAYILTSNLELGLSRLGVDDDSFRDVVWITFTVLLFLLIFWYEVPITPPRRLKRKLNQLDRDVNLLQALIYTQPAEESEEDLRQCKVRLYDIGSFIQVHTVDVTDLQIVTLQSIADRMHSIGSQIRQRRIGRLLRFIGVILEIVALIADILSIVSPAAGNVVSRLARGTRHLLRDSDDHYFLPPGKQDKYLDYDPYDEY